MDNKLPMARKEIERWTVLLDRESDSQTKSDASGRNKRKESSPTSRRDQSGSAEDTQRQSKSSRKAKGTNASSSRPKGYKRNHTDRKQNRRAEGENTRVWRSAKELGIALPDRCSSAAHYWIGVENISTGTMFRCKYCLQHVWLPGDYSNAVEIGHDIQKLGSEGYCKYLDKPSSRPAKILLAKLQELERLSSIITDPVEMAKIAVKILDQKEYDRRYTMSWRPKDWETVKPKMIKHKDYGEQMHDAGWC